MRGPLEEQAEAAIAAGIAEDALPPTPSEVPGGKALARLHQFELERDIELTDVAHPEEMKQLAESLLAPDLTAEVAEPAGARRGRKAKGERPAEQGDSPYLAGVLAKEEGEQADMVAAAPAPHWTPLGPFSIPHGQTYGEGPGSRPSVAGRVSSVAIDPTDPAHILIGAAGGGVWETRDGGRNWHPRTDKHGTLAIGAVAFAPNAPQIAYAGTGEGDFYQRLGVGLLRSTDGGRTWELRSASNLLVGGGFYEIVVAPDDHERLLAATVNSLCVSTDGGANWGRLRDVKTWDLSVHEFDGPAPQTEIFAGCADGLQRSTDGGQTWRAVNLPGLTDQLVRMEVCHAPSDGAVVYVFAASQFDGNAPVVPHLWRRSASDGAFVRAQLPSNLKSKQAWYDWFAAVAPDNPDVLYLGTIDVHRGVRNPTNNTWSWTNISARDTGDSIHPDQHAIAFSPNNPNVVYIGNDGGVYRSDNAGRSWTSLNKGLCITEVEYLAGHPEYEAWIIAGTQDNGTMRYEGSVVWPHVADGDGGHCGVNNSSPQTCFHTFYGMGMRRSTTGGGWDSWTPLGPIVPRGYRALFYPPLQVNGRVVVQAGQSVFISSDEGTTKDEVPLPDPDRFATALAVPTSRRVLVGTAIGNCYRIDRVGAEWQTPVALTRPRQGVVSDIVVDPTNQERYWATYSGLNGPGHVYRSDDAGVTWNNVSTGLPPRLAVNTLVVDPVHPERVYVGTDVGVYRTTDAGESWSIFGQGLPNAIVGDLLFHATSRLLRAGTRSRGVWEIPVDAAMTPDVELYLRDSAVDIGRRSPSPSGGADPFAPGTLTDWANSVDIKVDSSPFQRPSVADLDFEFFEDDAGVAAAGLRDETVRGATRVFVQTHNRGPLAARNVNVRLFFADGATLPDLPAGFWTDYPNNVLPPDSRWRALAPARIVPTVEAGKPQVAGFEWQAPGFASNSVYLLAILTAENDPVQGGELNVTALVRNNHKCALKKVAAAPPGPSVPPAPVEVTTAAPSAPVTGVQWRGVVPANQSAKWFSFNWPAQWHVVWSVLPTTPATGGAQIKYDLQVERASEQFVTYWFVVTNLTSADVEVEGRYCILSKG